MSASLLPYARAFALDDNALPSGGTVTGGSATLDYSNPGRLDVHQGSDRAVINWDSFNIGQSATTQFYQPSSSSVVVNKVTGSQDPTQILGTLKANGTVFVLDKNGVIFGHNSVVNVGSIVVSTGNIDETAFMNGDDQIKITGIDTGGSIINKGTITASEAGLAAFVAPTVVNDGVIQAKMGRVALAAGTAATVDLYGDGLVEVAADAPLQQALISNNGIIRVSGGYALLTASGANEIVKSAINNDGVIDASSATADGGKIVLAGAGDINVNGTLDASGATGGGTILVGGDYQGGGTVAHADNTTISDLALLRANTTGTNGNGGKIVVWSDKQTKVAGKIEANAGSASGNGGSIETSSKDKLNIASTAKVSASAPNGKNGEWLLDPRNVILRNSAGTSAAGGGTINAGTDDETVNTGTIETALNNGLNVTITTGSTGTQDGDITVQDSITKSGGTDTSLTLQAARNIYVENDIKSTVGKLNLVLNADRDANHDGGVGIDNADIVTNGGYFVAGGGAGALGGTNGILGDGDGTGADDAYAYGNSALTDNGFYMSNGTITTAGGNVYISGASVEGVSSAWGVNTWNSSINGGAGNIKIRGDVSGITGSYDHNYGVMIQGNTHLNTTSGNIDITGTGGQSDNGNNVGIYVTSSTLGTTSGGVKLVGNGGKGDDSDGVRMEDSTVTLTGANNLVITGNSGSGRYSDGVYMDNTDLTTGSTGKILMTGTTQTGGPWDIRGIRIQDGSSLNSDYGNIELTGTGGGDGTDGNNYGVQIDNSIVNVLHDGNVIMTGTGGYGFNAIGVLIDGGSQINALGNGNVTIHGIGGTGDGSDGVKTDNGSSITISGDGDLSITGDGGAGDESHGLTLYNSNLVTDGAGDITLNGTAHGDDSDGILSNYGMSLAANGTGSIIATGTASTTATNGAIGMEMYGISMTTTSGDINLTGVGGGDGTDDDNFGMRAFSSSFTVTGNGDIIMKGTAGKGDSGYGIHSEDSDYLNANGNITLTGIGSGWDGDGLKFRYGNTITTNGAGDITLNGTGGIGYEADGILLYSDTTVHANGTGDINLISAGGTTTSGLSDMGSIWIDDGDIKSASGDISIYGHGGGQGTDVGNKGIYINDGSTISSTAGGDITLVGIGGTSDNGDGIYIEDTDITTTGIGKIALDGSGNASAGYHMFGLGLHNVNFLTDGGDIELRGVGGGTAGSSNTNRGIDLDGSVTLTTTSGNITATGIGGTGQYSDGVRMYDTVLSNTVGDIIIAGYAGQGDDSPGVLLDTATITAANNGKIKIDGTGNVLAKDNAVGVVVRNNSALQTVHGNIEVTGTGGGDGTGSNNYGISIYGVSGMNVTDDGDIILNGTGGYGANADGLVADNNTSITNVDGDINLTGRNPHGNNHNNENGLFLNDNTTVATTGAGNITLDGSVDFNDTGADGTLAWNSTVQTSGTGNINVTGVNGGGNGFAVIGSSVISSAKALVAKMSSLYYENTATFSAGTDMTVKSYDATKDIGLASGTGDLILNDNFLDDISVGRTLIIGDATATGAVNIVNWDLSAASYDAQVFGKNIDLGGLDMGSGDVWLYAVGGNLTNSVDTNTNASGNLTLLAGDDIAINEDLVNAGAGHISLFAGWDGTSALQVPSVVNPNSIVLTTGTHDITLSTNGKVASAGTGTSVLFAASDKFINNASLGMAAIDSGAGRFLIYSNREDTTVPGSVVGVDPNIYGKNYMNLSPSSVTGGSRFIYNFDPNAPVGGGTGGSSGSAPGAQSSVDNQASNIQTISADETQPDAAKSVDCLTTEETSGRCVVE